MQGFFVKEARLTTSFDDRRLARPSYCYFGTVHQRLATHGQNFATNNHSEEEQD
jgi:hypothetical protein